MSTAARASGLALVACMAFAAHAVAQPPHIRFGARGQLIVGAERMFGLSFGTTKDVDAATSTTTTQSTTNVNVLWSPGPLAVYEIPRLSCDYVAVAGLTLGGSVGYFSRSGTSTVEAIGGSTKRDAMYAFLVAPRVSYTLPLSERIAFWPRAGVTYHAKGAESTSAGTSPVTTRVWANGFGVDMEAMFALSFAPSVAAVAGPVLDLPVSGTQRMQQTGPNALPPQPDDRLRQTNWGLAFGLIGYF